MMLLLDILLRARTATRAEANAGLLSLCLHYCACVPACAFLCESEPVCVCVCVCVCVYA